MATKKNDELATLTGQNTAVATADDFGGGLVVQGIDEAGPQLSRIVLFQGTAEEAEMYGEHKRGTFLDALESRELGDKIRLMPVAAWATWAKFVPGGRVPEYSHTDKALVPREDLEWGEDGQPPAATMSVNVVIVVEGEAWPYLFVFKRTGLKAFNKCIRPIEARRASMRKCPGLYELTSVDDKSGDGKPYKRLICRSVGDPTTEMADLARTIFTQIDAVKSKAEAMVNETHVEGDTPFDDDCPI